MPDRSWYIHWNFYPINRTEISGFNTLVYWPFTILTIPMIL